MKVRQPHDSFYPGKPHIVSDNVAYTRESDGDTSALQLFDKTQQLVTCTNVDEVDGTEIYEHSLDVLPHSQGRYQRVAYVADAGKEEIAAYSPNHQSRKNNCLAVTLNVPIGLCIGKLAERCSVRMAGSIDQNQQRQHDT